MGPGRSDHVLEPLTPVGPAEPGHEPHRWFSTNRVGVSSAFISSAEFNAHPTRLRIHGTRESALGLFRLLDTVASMEEASEVFRHFMALRFGLQAQAEPNAPRRWRASYLRLLQGWGFDANGPEGAVLKGWVESRFGLVPRFHGEPLTRFPSPAWVRYIEQKMSSRFHNNTIDQQLDLLYEFCQWVVRRFGLPARGWVPVWRGVDAAQLADTTEVADGRRLVMFNNLVSFSLSDDRAEPFGACLLRAELPVQKLLFFPGLLGPSLLAGEGEVIALGGACWVQVCKAGAA